MCHGSAITSSWESLISRIQKLVCISWSCSSKQQKRNGPKATGCGPVAKIAWIPLGRFVHRWIPYAGVIKETEKVKLRASKAVLHSKVHLQKWRVLTHSLGSVLANKRHRLLPVALVSKWKSKIKDKKKKEKARPFMPLLQSHLYPLLSKGPSWRQMLPKRTITKTGQGTKVWDWLGFTIYRTINEAFEALLNKRAICLCW